MEIYLIPVTSFFIAFSGALVPGPLLAITIEDSVKKGFKAGPLIIAGHALLEFILIILLVKGFGGFLKKEITVDIFSVTGGIFLLWMGSGMLRKKNIDVKNFSAGSHGISNNASSVMRGILGSLLNPYWSIWWVTIGLSYIAVSVPHGIPGVALFFMGHISADFTWYSIISYSVSKGREKFSVKVNKRIFSVCGVFLISFGIWLIYKAII
jgi:threonine/homoserine/homoserine lactone efflux protein